MTDIHRRLITPCCAPAVPQAYYLIPQIVVAAAFGVHVVQTNYTDRFYRVCSTCSSRHRAARPIRVLTPPPLMLSAVAAP